MPLHDVRDAVFQALCNTRDILARPRHHQASQRARVGMFVTELRRINVHYFPGLQDKCGNWMHKPRNWRGLAIPGLKPWGISNEDWAELCYWIREAKEMFENDKETSIRSQMDQLRWESRRALQLAASAAENAQKAEALTVKMFETLKGLDEKEERDER